MSLRGSNLPLAAMIKAADNIMPELQAKGLEPGSELAFEYASYLLAVERSRAAQMQKTIRRITAAVVALLICLTVALVFLLAGGKEPHEVPQQQPEITGAYYQEENFVASVNSDKFHRPTCDYAENILPENRVYYTTAQEAEDAGKTPCSVCNPNEEQEGQVVTTSSFSSRADWNKLHEAGCISMTYQEWLGFWASRENGVASDFLREAAEAQAEKIDEEYGPWAYGGTGWGLWTALRDAGYTSVSIEEFSAAFE